MITQLKAKKVASFKHRISIPHLAKTSFPKSFHPAWSTFFHRIYQNLNHLSENGHKNKQNQTETAGFMEFIIYSLDNTWSKWSHWMTCASYQLQYPWTIRILPSYQMCFTNVTGMPFGVDYKAPTKCCRNFMVFPCQAARRTEGQNRTERAVTLTHTQMHTFGGCLWSSSVQLVVVVALVQDRHDRPMYINSSNAFNTTSAPKFTGE